MCFHKNTFCLLQKHDVLIMLHILQYTSDKCYLGLSLLRCYCENRPDDLLFSVTLPYVVHNTSQYLLPSQYTLGVFCWEDIIISSIRYYCIILGIFCNFNILFVMTMIKIHSSRFYNQPSADEHNFFRFQPYGVYKTFPYVVLKLDDTRDLSIDFKNTFAFCPPVYNGTRPPNRMKVAQQWTLRLRFSQL